MKKQKEFEDNEIHNLVDEPEASFDRLKLPDPEALDTERSE